MTTEIALIDIKNPLQVFSTPKGLDAIIDKIEAEQEAEKKAAAAREADKNHKAKINNEIKNAIIDAIPKDVIETGGVEDYAKAVITAIAKGLVPYVKITY